MNLIKIPSEAELKTVENPVLSRPVTSGSLRAKGYVDAGMQVDMSRPSTTKSQQSIVSRAPVLVGFNPQNSGSRPSTAHSKHVLLIPRPVTQGSNAQVQRLPTADVRPKTRDSYRSNASQGLGKIVEEKREEVPRPETRERLKLVLEQQQENKSVHEVSVGSPMAVNPQQATMDYDIPQDEENKQEELDQNSVRAEEPLPVTRPQTAVTWKTTSSQRRYIEELERLLIEERKRRVLAETKLSVV